MVTSIYVSYLAISISHRSGNAKKYEVASPEIVHTERRDNKIIVNYAGRDYVLMHNNELNRPELFPTNRE